MITVVGLGYVGLTTALGFSHKGFAVYGYDTDEAKRDALRSGRVPFHEPHLAGVLKETLGKFFFVKDSLKDCIDRSTVIFYCVGTPEKETGEADLTALFESVKESLRLAGKDEYRDLVVKSTVPPTTIRDRIAPLIESLGFKVGRDIGLANNPEFLREGSSWKDFTEPDRIVIGQYDDKSGEVVGKLYEAFGVPVFRVSLNTAEFIKYLSNTFLATLISFSNQMSMVAGVLGDIDIPLAFKIAHLDKRWYGRPAAMTDYFFPGCGFGGYCLPKDTQAIYTQAKEMGYSADLLREVLRINQGVKEFVAERVAHAARKDDYIGICGLAFKPESDDIRKTVSKKIIELLLEKGFKKIIAYDPIAIENFKAAYSLPIEYAGSLEEIVRRAPIIVILTAWQEFIRRKDIFKGKTVLDFRYALHPPIGEPLAEKHE